MSDDHFEATFVLAVDRATAWRRLTEHPLEPEAEHDRYWLPGFDATVTVLDGDDGARLRVTKNDEPCAGTEIVVTLDDAGSGTRITVVQSGFGGWLSDRYEMMAVGWRHIVADLQTYLATGAHARRHLRPWPDLGADLQPLAGGLAVDAVRPDTIAARLGLHVGDLLVTLGGAPVSSYDDVVTAMRVVDGAADQVAAEWVRSGEVETATATTSSP